MVVNINGHSGFKLELLRINDKNVIRKTSPSKILSDRLKRQSLKQKSFINYNNFTSPEIINEGTLNDLYFFDSQFIYGYDFSQFFQIYDINSLKNVIFSFIDFIENNIKNSTYNNIIDVFIEKYESTKKNIDTNINFEFKHIDNFIYSYKEMNIPVGYCHGDLTFSNVILSRHSNKIYLLDFLDTFIDSPMHDIVKLRQDTQFYWSTNMIKNLSNVDINKIKLCLSWFDTYIVNSFSKYNFYTEYYKPFQMLNLLRVLQYADENISKKIIKSIETLYET